MGSEEVGTREGPVRGTPDARYETSGAVVLGASRSLIAPRVAAKRSLIKFYCAGIKLTGRLAGMSGYGLDK